VIGETVGTDGLSVVEAAVPVTRMRTEVEGRMNTSPGVRREYEKCSTSTWLRLEEQHAAVHDLHSVLAVGRSLKVIIVRPPDVEAVTPVARVDCHFWSIA